MSKASRAVKDRAGNGMTQEQLEDVLAQVAVLQGKVTVLFDRLALFRESACGTAGLRHGTESPSPTSMVMPPGLTA
jgi:hypothetical protein